MVRSLPHMSSLICSCFTAIVCFNLQGTLILQCLKMYSYSQCLAKSCECLSLYTGKCLRWGGGKGNWDDKWLYRDPEMVSAGVWPILASLWIFLLRRRLLSATPLRASDGVLANNSSLAAWPNKTNSFINLYQWGFASQILCCLYFSSSGEKSQFANWHFQFYQQFFNKRIFCIALQMDTCFLKTC